MSIEQNRIIAEFMGGTYPIESDPNWIFFDSISFADRSGSWGCFTTELHFDTSWSWLMPVVERIEAGSLRDVLIYDKVCRIEDPALGKKFMGAGETKIQAVYEAVVEYLTYINSK